MQHQAIEIHDSALDRISLEGSMAVLYFPEVYIHLSEGRPAIDAGTGWTQVAIIRIDNAMIGSLFTEWPRNLQDGYLKLNGEVSDNMIPIPLDHSGSVELRLEDWNEVVFASGTHIRLELLGEAQYVWEFSGVTKT